MIIINVHYMALNQNYDFKVEEHAPIRQITGEMLSMISQKEHMQYEGNEDLLLLSDLSTRTIFSPLASLSENGVRSGDTLILV